MSPNEMCHGKWELNIAFGKHKAQDATHQKQFDDKYINNPIPNAVHIGQPLNNGWWYTWNTKYKI